MVSIPWLYACHGARHCPGEHESPARFERYAALPVMSAGRAIRRRLPGRRAFLRRAQNRTSGAYTFRRRVVSGRDAQRGWSGENRRRASRPGLRRAELAGFVLDSWEIPLLKIGISGGIVSCLLLGFVQDLLVQERAGRARAPVTLFVTFSRKAYGNMILCEAKQKICMFRRCVLCI